MSGPRATWYAFGLAVLLLAAFHTKMGQQELLLWQGILVTGIPVAGLVLAFVRTLPRKPKGGSDNA
jgi:fermentation-respiration switch protein FrsA (DUF1100 family)